MHSAALTNKDALRKQGVSFMFFLHYRAFTGLFFGLITEKDPPHGGHFFSTAVSGIKPAFISCAYATVIAKDGIAVIVNNDSGVEELTSEQVKDVYTGNITTWEDLTK